MVVTSPQPFAEPDLSGVTDPNVACGGSLSFRITGPGVNLHTTLEDGDATADQLQATFQAGGTYTAFEDRRPTVARVVFTVVSGAAPTGGGGTVYSRRHDPKPAKSEETIGRTVLATLAGSVSTVGKLTLTLKGKRVSSLKAGRYKISVLDETSKSGFTLQKLGTAGTNVTSTKLVGKHSVTLVAEGRPVVLLLAGQEEDLLHRPRLTLVERGATPLSGVRRLGSERNARRASAQRNASDGRVALYL